jgi:acyl carrier protein
VDQAAIYSNLTPIFRDVLDDDSLNVTPGLTAKQVEGWDSLRNIRLMLTVEKAFKVKLSASEIGRLENVGDLVRLLQGKLEAQGRSGSSH